MTTPIANVTATYNGELVEVNSEIGRGDFDNLLRDGDEIIIHEVLHEEQVEDLKTRYTDDWEETVTFDGDEDDDDEDGEWSGEGPEPSIGTPGTCLHASCDEDAEVGVRVNTGQVRHYCTHHRNRTDRRGHMLVEEDWSL